MSVVDSASRLGKICADTEAAENYRQLWDRVGNPLITTFARPRWRQFAGVQDAIGVMRRLAAREPGIPDTLRDEIERALSSRELATFEEENRTWLETCDLIHRGFAEETGIQAPLAAELAARLGISTEDTRPVLEEFRESLRSSVHFRRIYETGKSQERRDLLQKSRETFDECMLQMHRSLIFPISEEALLYIYENIAEPKERKYVLMLYGLETTVRIVDQIVYQCVRDGTLPEFDTSHHIVSVESSRGILANDISLTLALHVHPGLQIGSIFRIHAEHAPRYAIALGLARHYNQKTGSYMDVSGLALDKDGLMVPLPALQDRTT